MASSSDLNDDEKKKLFFTEFIVKRRIAKININKIDPFNFDWATKK